MNAGELHRLTRYLRDLATEATRLPGEDKPSPGLIAVVEDLVRYPNSTISEIVGRVGLAQSFVSKTISELRENGLVQTEIVPEDRRKVRVKIVSSQHEDILRPRGENSFSEALLRSRPNLTGKQIERTDELLEELFKILEP
ncbi:helix-turn-helix domain-containing protein [Deinococcus xinjiangensis]|uniref:helix-turn-helix domain-containing protein n=1 Tax=Deinococcus xinjiangensis TaxID=457454 RepID=UPI003365B0B7